jgi:mono/diheme cytochrome c family protein
MIALLGFLLLAAGPLRADAGETGERIYARLCVSCHGKNGEGSAEFPRALTGDRSVAQLSRLIARTMPEDDPGTCVGPDADRVAEYIHDAFYSKIAQARNQPARVELARLTVKQTRNALADLVGSFRWQGNWGDNRGLKGEYYKSRQIGRTSDRVIERLDPEVKFDFGEVAPAAEKFDVNNFSIRWSGSVFAPDTGEYEFTVRSDHMVNLWVNGWKRPLIEAIVSSAEDMEHKGTIFLVGGRAYPIQLEFSKAKQGVDDSKNLKVIPKIKASVALEWRRPKLEPEVIPSRFLSPNSFPELFVVATPFPPDDRSVGYERGTSISKAWDSATTDAALATADYVLPRIKDLAGIKDDEPNRPVKVREFAARFAERAFRRPLTDDLRKLYVDRSFESAKDFDLALRRSILLILKSPRFLYRESGTELDPYDVASRLAFTLWDSLPDQALLDAAAWNQLATREQLVHQAERMASDPRARSKLRDFFLQWLRVEQVPDLAKDPAKHGDFTRGIVADLRTSLELSIDDLTAPGADFRQVLLADQLYLNGPLAKFYGFNLPLDAPFTKVPLEPLERAGLITHPYLMASFAYTATSSPIHRGVFLSRSILGRALKPPPEAVAPLAPDLHASLTTRERVALQTSPTACATCHGMINPLGFGLERFDAVGRLRLEEKGKPVDPSGSYEPPSGDLRTYVGARQLASLLSESPETHQAFVEQLFHHLVKQPIRAFGPEVSGTLRNRFEGRSFSIRSLMVDIAVEVVLPRPKPSVPQASRRSPAELPANPFAFPET